MNKEKNCEECPDYLMGMFENYFRFAKLNHGQISFEQVFHAMAGAMSGLNYPEVSRPELLQSFIDNCSLFQGTGKKLIEICYNQDVTHVAKEQEPQNKPISEKIWLNIDEVCERFGLPKSNIKDRQWRDDNQFPYIQTACKGRVTFNAKDVEKWMREHKN